MAVFIVSWALSREINNEDKNVQSFEFRTLIHVVRNAFSHTEAANAIVTTFHHTDEAQAGWSLVGPPSVLGVTEKVHTKWGEYIDPEPANETLPPPHLRPVK